MKQTVSQALAVTEERSLVEARLWLKLATACREAELPLDDEAPDFICAASSAPSVSVFRLAQEPDENEQEPPAEGKDLFGQDEEESE